MVHKEFVYSKNAGSKTTNNCIIALMLYDLGKHLEIRGSVLIGGALMSIAYDKERYNLMDNTGLPDCRLSNTDGNVFVIIGKVTTALKRCGQHVRATEFAKRAMNSGSYDEVLQLCLKYVNVS